MMIDARRYLAGLFAEFERMGYSEDQIAAALYDFYEKEMVC